MTLGILLQLCVDLFQILITIAALFGGAFARTKTIQHFGDHLPNAGVILAIRLEGALYALRFNDVQQRDRFGHIEVAFGGARRAMVVVSAAVAVTAAVVVVVVVGINVAITIAIANRC